jgi:hypothetical protein
VKSVQLALELGDDAQAVLKQLIKCAFSVVKPGDEHETKTQSLLMDVIIPLVQGVDQISPIVLDAIFYYVVNPQKVASLFRAIPPPNFSCYSRSFLSSDNVDGKFFTMIRLPCFRLRTRKRITWRKISCSDVRRRSNLAFKWLVLPVLFSMASIATCTGGHFQFFNQALLTGSLPESELVGQGKMYDLIYELYEIVPDILYAVLPQLEFKFHVSYDVRCFFLSMRHCNLLFTVLPFNSIN